MVFLQSQSVVKERYGGRPGFLAGLGAGIAAVCTGPHSGPSPTALATSSKSCQRRMRRHWGAMDSTLRATRALLIANATWIDNPSWQTPVSRAARCGETTVESTANGRLAAHGRGHWAGLLC